MRRTPVLLAVVAALLATMAPAATALAPDYPTAVRDGTWFLRQAQSSGDASDVWSFGKASDLPFYGDWDGDGVATPGVYRDGDWYLSNTLSGGTADISFYYGGRDGDLPIVGDWDGDGIDTVGVIRGGTWYLVDEFRGGGADRTFTYGRVAPRGDDIPLVGDWNGDGTDTVGVVRDGTWYLRNANAGGAGDIVFVYGRVGPRGDDIAITGDWDGVGGDTVGIVRGKTWYLRNANTGGAADTVFSYGADDDWKAVQGGFSEPTQHRIVGRPGQDAGDEGPRQGCHPSYPDNCFAYPPPDLDCSDFFVRGFRVVDSVDGYDPHDFDRDGNGIACESD